MITEKKLMQQATTETATILFGSWVTHIWHQFSGSDLSGLLSCVVSILGGTHLLIKIVIDGREMLQNFKNRKS